MVATSAARDDIGPNSGGEVARKLERLDELENKARRLEIENAGLQNEVDELRAAAKLASAAERDGTAPDSDEIARKLTRLERLEGEVPQLRQERIALRDEVAKLKAELARPQPAPTAVTTATNHCAQLTAEQHVAALDRKLPELRKAPEVRGAFNVFKSRFDAWSAAHDRS
jgi:chromosome segregation ATPase